MPSKPGLLLAALTLLAFGWSLTALKPLPQGMAVLVALAALLAERWSPGRAKPATFVVVTSLAALLGWLFAGSEGVARADRWLEPTARRAMPVGALLLGAAAGVILFV